MNDEFNPQKADQSVRLVENINPESLVAGPTMRLWYVKLSQNIKITRKGARGEPPIVTLPLEAGVSVPLARVLADPLERFPYVCAVGAGFPFFRVGRNNELVFEDVPRPADSASSLSKLAEKPAPAPRRQVWYSRNPERRVGY